MSAKNKAVIEKVNEAFTRNDVEGLLSYCADDFNWTMVVDKPLQGKDDIRKFMASGPSDPPAFTVDVVVADGDFVTCTGEMTMKDDDGQVVPYSYCDVWRFDGDRIAELKAFVIKTTRAS